MSEMALLIAPCRNFNGTLYVRIGIDDAGGLERIHNAERSIEPASKILAFEMRPGQQFWSGRFSGSQDVADAIDLGGEPCLSQPSHKPIKRVHMGLGKGWFVNAGLICADRPERIQIGQHPSTVHLRAIAHQPWPRSDSLILMSIQTVT